jgi:hypothetical protein
MYISCFNFLKIVNKSEQKYARCYTGLTELQRQGFVFLKISVVLCVT